MRVAGGIIALIAGIFGTLAAFFTLSLGGLGGALSRVTLDLAAQQTAETVVMLGWGGVVASFLTIILAAIGLGTGSKASGVLQIVCAVAGAILGGTIVAVFMALSLVGGVLMLLASSPKSPTRRPSSSGFQLAPAADAKLGGTFCTSCGSRIADGQAFCGACGKPAGLAIAQPPGTASLAESSKSTVLLGSLVTSPIPSVTAMSNEPLVLPQRLSSARAATSGGGVSLPGVVLAGTVLVAICTGVALWLNPSMLRSMTGSGDASGASTELSGGHTEQQAPLNGLGDALEEVKASFDCKEARTTVEVAICSDPTLAALDQELANAYLATRTRHPLPEYVLARQRDWLDLRENCASENRNACLQKMYRARLRELELPDGSMVFSNAAPFSLEDHDAVIEITPLAGASRLSVWGGFFVHRLASEEQGNTVYTGCEFEGEVTPSDDGLRWTATDNEGRRLVLLLLENSVQIADGGDELCYGFGRMPDTPLVLRPLP